MSDGNAVSNFIKKYQQIIPSPLMQSLAIAAFTVPVSYAIRKPFYRILKRQVRDPRVASMLFGTSPKQAQLGVQQMQNSWMGRHGLPVLIGSALPLVSLGLNTVPGAKNFGWTDWNPKVKREQSTPTEQQENKEVKEPLSNFKTMDKRNSLNKEAQLFQAYGYQPQVDLTQSVNRQQAIDMLNTNPFLIQQDPYARHLGTSIIAAAPYIGNQTTLGGIYDSAVNKFDNKLQFQGLGSKVVKGVVSGALAGMFTDVIGTVFGMPLNMRTGLANTVGVGKALHSILT